MTTTAPPRVAVDRDQLRFALASKVFSEFVGYWHFKNRETGHVLRFDSDTMWPGQKLLVEAMETRPWLFALKAGKLGFTEMECAFDVFRALAHPNARVHLFSKDQLASFDLLQYVKFGLNRLPKEWGITYVDEAGGNTSRSLKFTSKYFDPDDVRTIVSYPATREVAIDQSATHSHVDELAHIDAAEAMWNSISTTVAPGGTCHIVTRGSGPGYVSDLFVGAQEALEASGGEIPPTALYPLFVPFDGRPDRDPAWRTEQADKMTRFGIDHYAPLTAEDALAGDDTELFVRPEWWDACFDPDLSPLMPGDDTPIVLSVDAGYASDTFAIVGVSRHPVHHDQVAVRIVGVFDPRERGRVDLTEAERYIRFLCAGKCTAPQGWHPASDPDPQCEHCRQQKVPGFNVKQLCYDPYQMQLMAEQLTRDRVTWCEPFSQQADRLKADRELYDAILSRKIHWGPQGPDMDKLREHVTNAGAKTYKDGSSIRIEKLVPQRKVDACVAMSMAHARCLYLRL